jgi:membrane protease YdiL (CAAX protease family)
VPPKSDMKEVGLYFALTLGLSYLVFWGPLALFQIPAISFVSSARGPGWAIALFIIGGFVPSLVALILTASRQGRAGLAKMGRRIIAVGLGWRWYLALVLAIALPTAGQLLIIHALGGSFPYGQFLAQLGSLLPLIVLGPLSEELGWRGYALDRLQSRWNAWISGTVLGVLWALWHLPLFYMPGTSQHESQLPFVGFLVGITALSILFTWLHNNTGGSLFTALLFHWLFTYSSQVVSTSVTRTPAFNALEYLPYIVAALLVVIVWGPARLSRRGA